VNIDIHSFEFAALCTALLLIALYFKSKIFSMENTPEAVAIGINMRYASYAVLATITSLLAYWVFTQ
jgi:hypothetical protein